MYWNVSLLNLYIEIVFKMIVNFVIFVKWGVIWLNLVLLKFWFVWGNLWNESGEYLRNNVWSGSEIFRFMLRRINRIIVKILKIMKFL